MCATDSTPSADEPEELTVEDFLGWWLETLDDSRGTPRFLQLIALGFVVTRILKNPAPLLDELDRLNAALHDSLLAAMGDGEPPDALDR